MTCMPSWPMSSRRPMNGLTYFAPAFAARIAWFALKMSVVLILIPSAESALIAFRPSVVIWIFTTTFLWSFASWRPCLIISSAWVVVTSREIGPSTRAMMSWMTSDHLRPVFATRVGFVVIPSRTPQEAASRISSMSAVSKKILTIGCAVDRWPLPDMSISASREKSSPRGRAKLLRRRPHAGGSHGRTDPLAPPRLPPAVARAIHFAAGRPVHGASHSGHRRLRPRRWTVGERIARLLRDPSVPPLRPSRRRVGRPAAAAVGAHPLRCGTWIDDRRDCGLGDCRPAPDDLSLRILVLHWSPHGLFRCG